MFHKDLTEKIQQLTKRLDKFESRLDELKEAAYFEYYRDWSSIFLSYDSSEISASDAIEKILEHFKLKISCEPAKEKECHLVSTLPVRKPKKKVKKKAKKKK